MTSEWNSAAVGRVAGLLLMASGILIVALIMHHPTAASGTFLIRAIHGLLISHPVPDSRVHPFCPLATKRVGVGRSDPVRDRGRCRVRGRDDQRLHCDGPRACRQHGACRPALASNQVLASIGIVATAAAYSLWSVDLWRLGWRITTLFGLIAGLLPAVLLLSGHINMHIAGAILAYSVNAGWALWLGIML
jgi:hypothetical protein